MLDDAKRPRHFSGVKLLEKQSRQPFCIVGRANDFCGELPGVWIDKNAALLDSRKRIEGSLNLFAKELQSVDLEAIFAASDQEERAIFALVSKVAGRKAVLFQ